MLSLVDATVLNINIYYVLLVHIRVQYTEYLVNK